MGSVSPINHKPDYRLTGLYYDLHDKQLTNQKAVDSSGSYKAREKVIYICYAFLLIKFAYTLRRRVRARARKCGVVYSESAY